MEIKSKIYLGLNISLMLANYIIGYLTAQLEVCLGISLGIMLLSLIGLILKIDRKIYIKSFSYLRLIGLSGIILISYNIIKYIKNYDRILNFLEKIGREDLEMYIIAMGNYAGMIIVVLLFVLILILFIINWIITLPYSLIYILKLYSDEKITSIKCFLYCWSQFIAIVGLIILTMCYLKFEKEGSINDPLE